MRNMQLTLTIHILFIGILLFANVAHGSPCESDNESNSCKNVCIGTKVSGKLTDGQIAFVNDHYDYVVTSILDEEVRDQIKGPKLLLYRSVQDTWPRFKQFDWDHINSSENMFCHRDGDRIWTIYDSWLMNGSDLVDPNAPGTQDHWINYYATTASDQVYSYDYDGLFVDCASHRLGRSVVYQLMPDGYTDESWSDDRYVALEFIKSYLPDKMVIFNGLHSDRSAERSLSLTDGGMWEVFAFKSPDGSYAGEEKWRYVIELVERNSDDRHISIVSKKEHLTDDIPSRMFILSSYLLVSNQNVALTMSDLDYYQTGEILYYPEYEIDLGDPLGDYTVQENGVYERSFEKGMVIVNPDERESCQVDLERMCDKVVPVGGGPVQNDGTCARSIVYEPVADEILLLPMRGDVLIYR